MEPILSNVCGSILGNTCGANLNNVCGINFKQQRTYVTYIHNINTYIHAYIHMHRYMSDVCGTNFE